MSDAIRLATILVCVFNIGVMGALWERTGRLWLPKTWTRMLLASNMLMLASLALAVATRFHHPVTWRTPMFTLSATVELVALIGLHRWYGSTAGRAHVIRMTKGKGVA